jgi:lysozyme
MANSRKQAKRRRKFVIWSVVCLLLLAVGYFVYSYGLDYYRKYYACPGVKIDYYRYPVTGIDVSSHQGNIDWKEVYDSKVYFAFIKATEGENFVDKRFTKNWKEAKANNIIVGAYHFFRFNKEGKEQAYNFINRVELTDEDLPPVLDVELYGGNKYSVETKSKVISEIYNCLRTLERHYDKQPIIYTNVETYQNFIKGNFDDYDLWLCKLCNEPTSVKWKFWQYNHKGDVPGIRSEVDLNIFNGNYSDFINYIYGKNEKNSDS